MRSEHATGVTPDSDQQHWLGSPPSFTVWPLDHVPASPSTAHIGDCVPTCLTADALAAGIPMAVMTRTKAGTKIAVLRAIERMFSPSNNPAGRVSLGDPHCPVFISRFLSLSNCHCAFYTGAVFAIFDGPEFRRLRREANLAISEVAQGIISTAELSLVERGERQVTPAIGNELLRRIGIDTIDLEEVAQLQSALEMVNAALAMEQMARAYEIGTKALEDHHLLGSHPIARLISASINHAAGMHDLALEQALEAAEGLPRGSEERASALHLACKAAQLTGTAERAIAAATAELKALQQGVVFSNTHASLRGTCANLLAGQGQVEQALELTKMLVDDEANPWTRATSLWTQSDILWANGAYDKALLLAREALAAVEAANRPNDVARLKVTNAYLELQMPDFDPTSVQALLDEAEVIHQVNGSVKDDTLGVRAVLLARTGRIDEAIALEESVLAGRSLSNHTKRAGHMLWLGRFEAARGNKEKAITWLDASLLELSATDNTNIQSRTWRVLGSMYETLGEPAKSLECLKRVADHAGMRLSPIDEPSFLPV